MLRNITYELCCKNCLKFPAPYVNAIMDNRPMVGGEKPEIDISEMQNFITEYQCNRCGSVGKFWILDSYVDGAKNLERKTVFTFKNRNGDTIVENPINELVVGFSGDDMIELGNKQLESNKVWYMAKRTTDQGQGIIMWGLNNNYQIVLPIFDFEDFAYNELKTLLHHLKHMFNG